MKNYAVIVIALLLALPLAAHAQGEQFDDRPSGTIGSGSLSVEQIQQDIVQYQATRNGINVFFVLPRGWELLEEGLDEETGELAEGVPAYMLLSRAPVADPDDPTDFIFELAIYEQKIKSEGETDEQGNAVGQSEQFRAFLDAQLSQALGRGWKVQTPVGDIVPKPYGAEDRPFGQTAFVPIFYETQGGAMLYTFTSVTWETIWMIRFLVSEDQSDNYGALIALMLDNTFALTDEQFEEVQRRQEEAFQQQMEQMDKEGGQQ